MRYFIRYMALTVLGLIASIQVSAESIRQGTEKDVDMLLDAASGKNSAYWASYIGNTRGRTYILYESAVHTSSLLGKELNRVIYWFPEEVVSEENIVQFKQFKETHSSDERKSNK